MTILNEQELAQTLQLGTRQARALMRTESFPSFRIGRAYRVEEGALLEWIRTNPQQKLDYSKC
jgi:predicted DNA-binding transcriptional regulator AlpA